MGAEGDSTPGLVGLAELGILAGPLPGGGAGGPCGGCCCCCCSAAAIAAILPLKPTNGWPGGMLAKGPNAPGKGRVERRSFSISASFSLFSFARRFWNQIFT